MTTTRRPPEQLAGLVTSSVFRRVAPRVLPRVHRVLARISGGRFVPGAGIVLTSTGARSGKERTTPLEAIPVDEHTLIVVGSNFAQEQHPAWTHNLIAHPDCAVLRHGESRKASAVLLDGDERADAWNAALAHWPAWHDYTELTDRSFRIFRLEMW